MTFLKENKKKIIVVLILVALLYMTNQPQPGEKEGLLFPSFIDKIVSGIWGLFGGGGDGNGTLATIPPWIYLVGFVVLIIALKKK